MTTHDDDHADQQPTGASLRWSVAFAVIAVVLAVIAACGLTGCVSPGEHQAVLDELAVERKRTATLRERNAEMVRDAVESRACWDAILEWFDVDEATLKRRLLGGQ